MNIVPVDNFKLRRLLASCEEEPLIIGTTEVERRRIVERVGTQHVGADTLRRGGWIEALQDRAPERSPNCHPSS